MSGAVRAQQIPSTGLSSDEVDGHDKACGRDGIEAKKMQDIIWHSSLL